MNQMNRLSTSEVSNLIKKLDGLDLHGRDKEIVTEAISALRRVQVGMSGMFSGQMTAEEINQRNFDWGQTDDYLYGGWE